MTNIDADNTRQNGESKWNFHALDVTLDVLFRDDEMESETHVLVKL